MWMLSISSLIFYFVIPKDPNYDSFMQKNEFANSEKHFIIYSKFIFNISPYKFLSSQRHVLIHHFQPFTTKPSQRIQQISPLISPHKVIAHDNRKCSPSIFYACKWL